MNRKKVTLARNGRLHKKYERAEQQLSLALRNTLLAEMNVFETVMSQLPAEEQHGWWKRLVDGLRKIDKAFSSSELDTAVAALESTPHGVTKRRHPRKRLRSE